MTDHNAPRRRPSRDFRGGRPGGATPGRPNPYEGRVRRAATGLRRFAGAGLVVALALGGTGCDRPADPGTATVGPPPAGTTDAGWSLAEADETVLAGRVRAGRGRVVLVDYWATWCPPCVERLPHILDLAAEHDAAGLTVLTISLDDVGDRAAIEAALTAAGPPTTVQYVSPYGVSTAATTKLGVEGSLPYYRLYDRRGQWRYAFTTTADLTERMRPVEEIDERVAELLAEAAG